MSNIIMTRYALSIRQSFKATRLIVKTISNNKKWIGGEDDLYDSLSSAFLKQRSYEEENENHNRME